MKNIITHSPKNSTGFTLLEVLITMVVFAIGLLGLAGLQANSLQANQQSYLRSQVTILAYDMTDRIRANSIASIAGDYNDIEGAPTSHVDCDANLCTPSEMAEFDAFQWNATLEQSLPSGRGDVTGDSTTFTVTIMWDDERTGATGTDCEGASGDVLTCFQVNFRP